jgi:cytochrome d ubiquinol oxidase subunit II
VADLRHRPPVGRLLTRFHRRPVHPLHSALAALGIIARGAAFAFRKASTELWQQRLFGACFALSSVLTPFFLGTVAGAVASGRVPPGLAEGDVITSWLNPTSLLGGILAVLTCAHLAAVYLCADAARGGDLGLVTWFRIRALVSGLASGGVALAGIAVLHADASRLFHGLTHRGLPLVVLSACAGLVALALLRRRPVAARVPAALAVALILWAWGAAQYPAMLVPDVTVTDAASQGSVLLACLVSLAVGAALLIPSLWWLYSIFQRGPAPSAPYDDQPHGGPGSR